MIGSLNRLEILFLPVVYLSNSFMLVEKKDNLSQLFKLIIASYLSSLLNDFISSLVSPPSLFSFFPSLKIFIECPPSTDY